MRRLTFLIGQLFLFSQICIAQVIHVPADQPTIQDGINYASNGDTVLVAQGIYYENIDFSGKAITVASHNLIDPDSSHILHTIIDGSQPSNPDRNSMVYFISGEDTNSILYGFTIQNGTGTYPDAWGDKSGGGIFCEGSGAKIIRNRIIDNIVDIEGSCAYGGGISAGTCPDRLLVIKHNLIANNSVCAYFWYPAGGGGGATSMHTILQHNIIKNNTATGMSYGGGFQFWGNSGFIGQNLFLHNQINSTEYYGYGGGLFIIDPVDKLIVKQNTFTENYCDGGTNFAGGICVYLSEDIGETYIENNILSDNNADNGGGLYLCGSYHAYITNNVFQQNEADDAGGGIFITNQFYSDFVFNQLTKKLKLIKRPAFKSNDNLNQIINNTFIDNLAWLGGGCGITNDLLNDDLLALNNIIYNNSTDEINTVNSSSTAYLYNNNINTNQIIGNWSGEGNIFEDPEFMDDSCHISTWSACLEAGLELIEINGIVYEAPHYDYEGDHRPDTTCGLVDIGADENNNCLGVGISETVENLGNLTCYPNPFTDFTTFEYTLDKPCDLHFTVYNLQSQIVYRMQVRQSNGKQQVQWNAEGLPAGIYYFTISDNSGRIGGGKLLKY